MIRSRRCERVARQHRRGFGILAWLGGLFCLAQLAGGLLLDYVWVGPRHPYMAHMLSALHAGGGNPEIVFLGSSRFGSDICCGVLDAQLRYRLGEHAPRTFDASVPAGDPTVFQRVLDELLLHGCRPRLVVVEISPETVNHRDNWLHHHALNLLDWRDLPEAVPALLHNGKILNLLRGRFLPLHVHRYHICKEARALVRALLLPGPDSPVAIAAPVFSPLMADPAPPPQTPAGRALLEEGYELCRHDVRDYRPGGLSAHRLDRLLEKCRSAGMAVVLVGVPVASPYRRAYTPEVEAAFHQYVMSLTDRYGCSYTDWRDRVPDEYFSDARHVYPQGGVYFSRRLAASILAPLWSNLQVACVARPLPEK
jgi:hypothetical protein